MPDDVIPRPPLRCLGVIPARAGSKRVPGKNVRPFVGRPILAYTVEAALESGVFERVIVSTDSAEIARLARGLGADVPFLRPVELADDVTPVSQVTRHALEHADRDATTYRAVAQLMPTCPLRTAADVRESFRCFHHGAAASQISVARYGWQNPWWAMKRDPSGTLEPLFDDQVVARSQDLPEIFCPTGAIWWAKADVLRATGTYHLPGRTGWELPWERGIDIDTEEDWRLAELLHCRARVTEREHGN
jgi:pseudaminic acid cytidylyltransferase